MGKPWRLSALADRVRRATRRAVSRHGGAAELLAALYGPGWALVGMPSYHKDEDRAGITDAFRDAEGPLRLSMPSCPAAARRRMRWRSTNSSGIRRCKLCMHSPASWRRWSRPC
jgi:hypothetical protein